MSYQGRSLDDLPLAAYSTGMVEDGADDAPEPDAERPPMDARAAALSIVEPAALTPAATASAAAAGAAAREAATPAPGSAYSPPFASPGMAAGRDPDPSVPTQAPRAARRFPLLHLRMPRRAATPRPSEGPATSAVARATAVPAPAPVAAPAAVLAPAVVAAPAALRGPGTVSARPRLVALPQLRLSSLPRDPKAAVRDPRVLAGGGIVLGALVLFMLFGRGASPGAATPGPSATPGAAVATPTPGAVTVTFGGAVSGDFTLAGSAGFGHPANGQLAATWMDGAGSSLTMTGEASSGTRPTGPDLVLTWTLVVKGAPETFTSDRGECVVGMALKPSTVSGSIECRKLRSDDGKLVLNVSGTYRT